MAVKAKWYNSAMAAGEASQTTPDYECFLAVPYNYCSIETGSHAILILVYVLSHAKHLRCKKCAAK